MELDHFATAFFASLGTIIGAGGIVKLYTVFTGSRIEIAKANAKKEIDAEKRNRAEAEFARDFYQAIVKEDHQRITKAIADVDAAKTELQAIKEEKIKWLTRELFLEGEVAKLKEDLRCRTGNSAS